MELVAVLATLMGGIALAGLLWCASDSRNITSVDMRVRLLAGCMAILLAAGIFQALTRALVAAQNGG